MRRFQFWAAILICWVAWVTPGQGQSLPEWLTKGGSPKPPDFGIRDEDGFFNRDAGAFKRISDQLRKLEAEHGYKIYLMVKPVLIGTTAPELAAQLRQAWLPDGNGLVVVYEADGRSLGIGRALDVSRDPKAPEVLIPTHETAALINRAIDAVDAKLAPEAYIEALAGNLVEGCNGYFTLLEAPMPAGRSMRMGLLFVGAMTLLGLVTMGVGWLLRHSPMAEVQSFRFPVVDRPERLGAPCGAAVTARRFGPPAAKRV
ncbi:MAG: TPM domain-containing protein [Luteolibacter sp.]